MLITSTASRDLTVCYIMLWNELLVLVQDRLETHWYRLAQVSLLQYGCTALLVVFSLHHSGEVCCFWLVKVLSPLVN